MIDNVPDSARTRLRPVLIVPLIVACPAWMRASLISSDVQRLGSPSGDPHLAEMRHLLGVQAARSDLDINDDIWVDAEKELLAEAQ